VVLKRISDFAHGTASGESFVPPDFRGSTVKNPVSRRLNPVGDKERKLFQFTFNGFLKVEFQGSRVTSDAGLVLVRELDERLGLARFIAEHLSDSRSGLNTQFGQRRKDATPEPCP
jgi:Transposase DDE domain group 1